MSPWWRVLLLIPSKHQSNSWVYRSCFMDSVLDVEGAGPSTFPERRCHTANGVSKSRRYHGFRTLCSSFSLWVEVKGSMVGHVPPCQEQSFFWAGNRIEEGVADHPPLAEEALPSPPISVALFEGRFAFRIQDFAANCMTDSAKDSISSGRRRIWKPLGTTCE